MSVAKRINEQFIELTEEMIRAGMKSGIGLKRQQAKVLGESMPLKSGWLQRSIGKQITRDKYDWFLECKGDEFKKKRRRRKKKNRPQ